MRLPQVPETYLGDMTPCAVIPSKEELYYALGQADVTLTQAGHSHNEIPTLSLSSLGPIIYVWA